MTSHTPHAEILDRPERRRRWTAAEKLEMVQETYEPGVTVSLIARRRGVAPNQLVPMAQARRPGRADGNWIRRRSRPG